MPQATVSKAAADVAEKSGVKGTNPDVIADPTGGGTVDAEARAQLILVLNLLRDLGITSAT